ncbi:hypothetical protein KDW_60980 [Dictyobacter vulcani]|uniref:Uncharacterized protein n=1 Tax=Dictyobacter vulcani TaxID=2607529 RepID=A0A5J4L398_9CHLR|nr:hypothetical protein [Dictyobacter vulcani]GER91936.1 hypothetical protein KDW_60980 [Dictyobacter vulcani]
MSQTNPQSVKQNRRDKQQRREAERLRAQQRQRKNVAIIIGSIVLVVAVIGIFIWRSMSAATPATKTQSTSTPTPAQTAYSAVNGITCDPKEQGTYHVHAHLSMYVNGKAVALPQTIGIAGDNSCIYWLHTHDTSGVIHIEAPAQRSFLLGDFMQLWKQRFSSLNYLPQLDQPRVGRRMWMGSLSVAISARSNCKLIPW